MTTRLDRNWGVTAQSTEWAAIEGLDEDGVETIDGFGFVRFVETGVVYSPPPLVEGLITWAEVPRSRGRKFAMAWHEDVEPAQVRTLLDFHAALASRRSSLDKADEGLRAFDEAVLQMVRLADRVHRAGGTLGFVQPSSVVFCTLRDGQIHAVFPDLGFAWDDQRGLMEPKWIADPELGVLFEEGARKHNAAHLELARHARAGSKEISKQAAAVGAAQAADVRMLAKLVAMALAGPDEVRRWCDDGRAFLKMPGRNVAPDTQAPVWDDVIAPALLGNVKTCAELAQRLEAAKPSEHFLFKPPAPPPVWKKIARQTAPAFGGLAALAALIGGRMVYCAYCPDCCDPKPPPLCPKVVRSSALYPQLFELVGLQTAALQEGAVKPYWDELKKCKDMTGASDCIPGLLAECAVKIDESARGLVEDLRKNPLPPARAREKLMQALDLVREAMSEVGTGPTATKLSGTARLLGLYLQALGGAATPAEAP